MNTEESLRVAVKAALARAIKAANDNQSELARRMNAVPGVLRTKPYRQQHINHWLKTGKVPPEHARTIEQAVNGEVSCFELCPGVFCMSDAAARAA